LLEGESKKPAASTVGLQINPYRNVFMTSQPEIDCQATCVSRRLFLNASGAATATMLLGELFPNRVHGQAQDTPVQVTKLPRQKIGQLSKLEADQPVSFNYPGEGELHNCMLIKTAELSGGGLGDAQDIVAFSGRCTHMGGSLEGEYNAVHKVAGPCRLHLTTFDLTRHGMVIAGHATEALPQIILELDGDDIYATGIAGLLYGYSVNG
jgi:arsenite oxidase small subunit